MVVVVVVRVLLVEVVAMGISLRVSIVSFELRPVRRKYMEYSVVCEREQKNLDKCEGGVRERNIKTYA